MSFSFNFEVQIESKSRSDEDSNVTQTERQDVKRGGAAKPETEVSIPAEPAKEALEHHPPPDPHSLLTDAVSETVTVGTLPPLHFLNESVFERTAEERADGEGLLSRTAARRSDLIPGVYEGGLKVWECTYDLLELLEREGETFGGRRVLDLGCGAGLLGILALSRGAAGVHFQDYNSTVIEQLTLPNVLINCPDEEEEEEEEEEGERTGKGKKGVVKEEDEKKGREEETEEERTGRGKKGVVKEEDEEEERKGKGKKGVVKEEDEEERKGKGKKGVVKEEDEEEERKGRGKKRGVKEEDEKKGREEETEEDDGDGPPPKKKRALAPPPPRRSALLARCRFFSGDWTRFLALVLREDPPPEYDIIFTCETIYNAAHYPALHLVLERLLAPGGLVYLATKGHYFGVGGGLHLFQAFVRERGVFRVERLWDTDRGLQRHVVALKFKTTKTS